jgi:hypothetical protein
MRMKKRQFGRDAAGRAVEEVTLESADAAVSSLSLGCIASSVDVNHLRNVHAAFRRASPLSSITHWSGPEIVWWFTSPGRIWMP